jgi:hypothetical protein
MVVPHTQESEIVQHFARRLVYRLNDEENGTINCTTQSWTTSYLLYQRDKIVRKITDSLL